MKKHMVEKDGIYGALIMAAKNPNTDSSKNLAKAGLNFQYKKNQIMEQYVIPVNGGIYQVQVLDFLGDQYGLEGVMAMGVNTNGDEMNNVLDFLLTTAGIVPLDQEVFNGNQLKEKYTEVLEKMVTDYANTLVINTPDTVN